jgi:hypothetical protein
LCLSFFCVIISIHVHFHKWTRSRVLENLVVEFTGVFKATRGTWLKPNDKPCRNSWTNFAKINSHDVNLLFLAFQMYDVTILNCFQYMMLNIVGGLTVIKSLKSSLIDV